MEIKKEGFPIIQENVNSITDEEIQHQNLLDTLLTEKRRGDWVLIGEMCGITPKNAELAFNRIHSKHHLVVVESLKTVISSRKSILTK